VDFILKRRKGEASRDFGFWISECGFCFDKKMGSRGEGFLIFDFGFRNADLILRRRKGEVARDFGFLISECGFYFEKEKRRSVEGFRILDFGMRILI